MMQNVQYKFCKCLYYNTLIKLNKRDSIVNKYMKNSMFSFTSKNKEKDKNENNIKEKVNTKNTMNNENNTDKDKEKIKTKSQHVNFEDFVHKQRYNKDSNKEKNNFNNEKQNKNNEKNEKINKENTNNTNQNNSDKENQQNQQKQQNHNHKNLNFDHISNNKIQSDLKIFKLNTNFKSDELRKKFLELGKFKILLL